MAPWLLGKRSESTSAFQHFVLSFAPEQASPVRGLTPLGALKEKLEVHPPS